MLPEQFQYIYAFDLQCGMGTLYHNDPIKL